MYSPHFLLERNLEEHVLGHKRNILIIFKFIYVYKRGIRKVCMQMGMYIKERRKKKVLQGGGGMKLTINEHNKRYHSKTENLWRK